MKLAVGIPNSGSIRTLTVFSLIQALKQLDCEYDLIFKEGSILHWNREYIVKLAIERGCTHVLFVDSDMAFEKDTITRLIDKNKDIIGVHYNLRKDPPTTTVHMDKEKKARVAIDHPDGLLTCDAVGTGLLLVNLDVFKKLSHPWFFWESDGNGEVVMGEDYWFCKKAREAGFDVWVDLTIPVKHIGDKLF